MAHNKFKRKSNGNSYSISHTNGKNGDIGEVYINKAFDENESNTLSVPQGNGNNYSPEEPEEREIEEHGEKEEPVNFFSLFRYSSRTDKLMMIVGCFLAVCVSCGFPISVVLFGGMIDSLVENHHILLNSATNETTVVNKLVHPDEFLDKMSLLAGKCGALGFIAFIMYYIMISFFSIAASNQAFRIKCLFMKAVLRQDIGWFDTTNTGDFATRITADLARVQDGIGENVCICLTFMSQTIFSIICAFCYGWKLTLVSFCIVPALAISTVVFAKIQSEVTTNELSSYGTAGAIAEEVLSAIRTVVAFGGEKKEIERYGKHLKIAKKQGIKRGLLTSFEVGLVWFCTYCAYALSFWYGVELVVDGRKNETAEYKPSNMVIVFFNVMMTAMALGQTTPYFEAFNLARGAASKVYRIIERIPLIDTSSNKGLLPKSLTGDITLKDVCFNYPARPDVHVLQGLTLEIKSGETVALVGPSGCGKSTIIQLIQRFYDTGEGYVSIDDYKIQDLNVGWLRDQIGAVGQEPVLFSSTIAENIRYGKSGATQKEVETAAKAANAHDFIKCLPQKYDTLVGERGTQLSGGQKQRIAIARALVKNPKILLLDEATSALDIENESIVQTALDKARQGRTTVIISHRLSTIRTADKIATISNGMVKEIGTHQELLALRGIYYDLVTSQLEGDVDDNANEKYPVSDIQNRQRTQSVVSSVSGNSDDTNWRKWGDCGITTPSASDGKNAEQAAERQVEPSKQRILKVSLPEWPYITVGCICALISGLFVPLYGILFGEIMGLLSKDDDTILAGIKYYSAAFFGMGIGAGLATFLQTFMFAIAGEKLTLRLRKMTFKNMICQDMSWFDLSQNSVGSLCSRLSSDASQVQGAGGARMSIILQAISTLMATIVIGVYYNWKVGMVTFAFIPLILIATHFESRMISVNAMTDKAAEEDASKVAIEAIESIRTVASLHQEEAFYVQFKTALALPLKKARIGSHVRGVVYGLPQSIPYIAYAVAMYYGSTLVASTELAYEDLLIITEAIIMGTVMVGQAVSFAPDYQKAKAAAVRMFKLLDQKSELDVFSTEGNILANVSGRIEFKDVHFNYPSRPSVKILKGLNLRIEPGKTVALVGSSGCGKTTCMQLLERFYEAASGEVIIDGKTVESLSVSSLRAQIGMVSQEPTLLSYSVAENIAYGDNTRVVPMVEIIAAARNANIHNFISTLPKGYHTAVGDKGTQLSGGQKQRIAIARALVRNPKVLLLDEATSALDADAEKVVQEALDKASDGRTCVTIAHRFSTIQNADEIAVIHKGRIVEKGSHQQLLASRGHYYNLQKVQSGIKLTT